KVAKSMNNFVVGTSRSSSVSIAGLDRRGLGWWRPDPALLVPRLSDNILRSFFNMTRAFSYCDVVPLSRQAIGLIASMSFPLCTPSCDGGARITSGLGKKIPEPTPPRGRLRFCPAAPPRRSGHLPPRSIELSSPPCWLLPTSSPDLPAARHCTAL